MGREFVVVVVLVLAGFMAYGQVAGYGFADLDDDQYVFENPHVRRGITWEGAGWALTTLYAANWHPLTWLSHMLDCELFSLDAGYHHLVSVFLHIANSVLLFLVFRRMTGAVWRSGMVAGLFLLHPLHVESVAWIAERKDVLSTLFFLLTLWAYGGYAARPGLARYGLVAGFLGLGLMAKPMLVTAPFVLLLLDCWPLGRFGKVGVLRLVGEKVPLFLMVAASSVVTFVAQHREGATSLTYEVPFGVRVENALVSYVAYLGKTLWPVRLAVFYPYRSEVATVEWAGALFLLLGISVWLISASRERGYWGVGWLWYLGTLVPVIGLVQVGEQAMADRYTYVPLIGVFVMGVWGLGELVGGRQWVRMGAAGLAGLVLMGCMVCTRSQVGHWENGVRLFKHALEVTRGSALVHNNLGVALMGRGRIEEAIAHYQEALRLRPGYATAHNNLGLAFLERGRPVEAIAQYRKALVIEPENAALHTNLGDALMAQGEAKEALVHFQEALRIEPNDPRPYNNLAWIRATHPDPRLRDGKEAVDLAERACGLWGGNHPNLLDTLAAAYAEEGRFVEAVATAEKALAASTGLNDLASEIEGRLEGYKAGRPFRESRATSGHGAS